jgi:hypothetical protein
MTMNRNQAIGARPTMGSTGVSPVPAGVPPGGSRDGRNSLFGGFNAPSRRLGGTPSRTGGTPVLPIVGHAPTESFRMTMRRKSSAARALT